MADTAANDEATATTTTTTTTWDDEAAVRALEEAERAAAESKRSKRVRKPVVKSPGADEEEDDDVDAAVAVADDDDEDEDAGDPEDDGDEDDGGEADGGEADDDDDADESEEEKPKKKAASKAAATTTTTTKPKATPARKRAAPKEGDGGGATTKKAKPAAAAATTTTTTGEGGGGDDASIVLKYLESTNRPYNAMAIFENLHRSVGKTKLQKVLDDLVASGEICEAGETGKVYWVNQDRVATTTEEEDAPIVAETAEADARAKKLGEAAAGLRAACAALQAEPTQAELPAHLAELRAWIGQSQTKLDDYDRACAAAKTTTTVALSTKDLTHERDFWLKHAKARKAGVMELLSMCAASGEAAGGVAGVAEQAGIELD